MQVIFTIVLSVFLFHERVPATAVVGTSIAIAGLATVGAHLDATVTPLGLALILCAAFCWGCANVCVKMAARARGAVRHARLHRVSSVFAVPPLVALSLVFEGPAAMEASLRHASWAAWAAVAWQRSATRSSASRPGAGCSRSTTPRSLRPWRC
jgi:O-acetylserine/cysteine efflux transporter